jgi:hypothetical protein
MKGTAMKTQNLDLGKILAIIALLVSALVLFLLFDKERASRKIEDIKNMFSRKKETADC